MRILVDEQTTGARPAEEALQGILVQRAPSAAFSLPVARVARGWGLIQFLLFKLGQSAETVLSSFLSAFPSLIMIGFWGQADFPVVVFNFSL